YALSFLPCSFYFLSFWPARTRLNTFLFAVFSIYVMLFSPFYYINTTRLMVESMRDLDNIVLQQDLYSTLDEQDDGKLILVDMGEVGPTIYDLKLPIKRYVHQGAKPYWNFAYTDGHPERVAGWVIMQQDDKLWEKFHDNPDFHTHFALVGRR